MTGTRWGEEFYSISLSACYGLWTPADLRIQAIMDGLVLPSVNVKTLGIRNKRNLEAVPALQGARSPLRPTEFPVYASPVLFPTNNRDSATGATLGTGGWLTLARQRLSLYKIHRAFLGAITPST